MAGFLVEYGLRGVLLTIPAALFMVLGLKKKNHWAFLFGAGLFLALGCAILEITLEGIVTGEVFALSRSTLMVKQISHPVFFWISTWAFLAGSLAMADFGLFLLVRSCLSICQSASSDKLL